MLNLCKGEIMELTGSLNETAFCDDGWDEFVSGDVSKSTNAAAIRRSHEWSSPRSYYNDVAESRKGYHHLDAIQSFGLPEGLFVPQTTAINPVLEQKFKELVSQWREETAFISSTSEIVSKFSYYCIIALGKDAIPLILRELKENGGHWFLALQALTGENPVKPGDIGRMRVMAQAWLDWGQRRNLI